MYLNENMFYYWCWAERAFHLPTGATFKRDIIIQRDCQPLFEYLNGSIYELSKRI